MSFSWISPSGTSIYNGVHKIKAVEDVNDP